MSGTDLQPRPPVGPQPTADEVTLIHPTSGEVLDLHTASTLDLAHWRHAVREWEDNARQAKKLVDAEILDRMDRRGEWTVHEDGFDLVGSSPEPSDSYDAEALQAGLAELVDVGLIDEDAASAAVEIVTTLKPNRSRISKLRKLGGRVAAVIEAATTQVPKDRRVNVKKAGGG